MADRRGSADDPTGRCDTKSSQVSWLRLVVRILCLTGPILLLEAVLASAVAYALPGEFGFVWAAIAAHIFPAIGVVGLLLGVVLFCRARRHALGAAGVLVGVIAVSLFPYLRGIGLELAHRGMCQYGLAFLVEYIIRPDANGRFPPDIHGLFARYPDLAQQPICSSPEPASVAGAFTYIPDQRTDDDPRNVLMYERPSRHRSLMRVDGGHVLYLDMHHDWVEPYSRVLELVEQTKQRLAARAAQSPPAPAVTAASRPAP